MTLGEKIYKLRTKRSMTQEQLAEKIGVSRQSVSKWETDSAIPDIEKLKLLAEIFEVSITELLGMECEEDTKRKDEKERIEHCQKEIKRWKRYAIVLIAISAVLLAACIGGSIYVRYFIIEEKSNNTEAQTTQIVQQETDEDSEQIGRPKGIISEFYRSVRCSEDGKIYLKLKCVLVQDSAETQMTGLVKTDESDGNISVDMVKKENGYEGEAEIPVSYLENPVNISLNIDKSGEKQNVVIDTDSTEYLLEQIDWLPMADLEADETGNGEYQSGYLNVRALEQKYMKNVEDVKLEMKIGKKKVFKKELSSREWKDLKNHGQIGYSYEYKNTGKLYDDYTDGKIIIKIKYYNKELKKNVEIWINPWEGIESREKILLKD